jgi:hypothetical protein
MCVIYQLVDFAGRTAASAGLGRSETCRRPSLTIGEATPGIPPRSIRSPRATTWGSAKTSATSLIGPGRDAGRRQGRQELVAARLDP